MFLKKALKLITSLSILMVVFLDLEKLLCIHESWEESSLASIKAEVSSSIIDNKNSENIQYLSFSQLLKTKLDLSDLPPKYPKDLKQLEGQVITTIGFGMPLDKIKNAQHFMLKRNSNDCQYCSDKSVLLNLIYVKLKNENTIMFSEQMVKVTGKLNLLTGSVPLSERGESYEDMSVFSLLNSRVENASEEDKQLYLKGIYKHLILEKQQL